MKNLSSTSYKHACKLSLILLICASFVLQTNITKPLAETLTSLASPSPLVGTLEEADDSLVTPDDPDQAILPDNPQATTEDLSQSATSESSLQAETPQTDTLGAPFAWNPITNVLTIQGDCNASDIKNEIASEASAASEVCFSGALTITTDQGSSSPFSGATNLERITALDGTYVSFVAAPGAADPTLKNSFRSCSNLTSIDGLASWDISSITGPNCMQSMFLDCISLTSLEALASWDVSNVTGSECMGMMFINCSSLISLEGLASWDVSNVSGTFCMYGMFQGCSSLISLNGLESWNVSGVSEGNCMESMFRNCTSLTSLEALASWNVSNVSGAMCMCYMFRDCTSLTSLDGLGSWNVSNVSGNYCMDSMFYGCTGLQDITDIASWNLANAKSSYLGVNEMFSGCSNITYIQGAATDASGFVPTSAMDIPTLVSANNFCSEQAPTTPVSGSALVANWSTYAPQGTWTWKQSITFDANGGTGAPSPELIVHNAYATQPTPEQNPTKAGFYFAGWTTDAAGSTRFDFAHTKLDTDITLYAQWSANPVYTVVFNTAGGSLEDTQYIVQGHTATRPAADPTRADYTFVDWYTDATGTALFNFATPISANTVVYAKWAANTLTATFDLNGGEDIVPAAITLSYGEVFPTDKEPADPTRAGYSFDGWYTEASEGSKVEWGTTTVTQTEDFVLYAHWTLEPSPSDGIVPEDSLLPQTGDASSALLSLLFIPAALGLFVGYAVLKRNEC